MRQKFLYVDPPLGRNLSEIFHFGHSIQDNTQHTNYTVVTLLSGIRKLRHTRHTVATLQMPIVVHTKLFIFILKEIWDELDESFFPSGWVNGIMNIVMDYLDLVKLKFINLYTFL